MIILLIMACWLAIGGIFAAFLLVYGHRVRSGKVGPDERAKFVKVYGRLCTIMWAYAWAVLIGLLALGVIGWFVRRP